MIPTVPVTITPEAAVRVAELGMQPELEQMLERIQQVVPQLRSIDVKLAERYDTGGEPGVTLFAWTGSSWRQNSETWWSLARWQGATFPPQVLSHLSIDVLSGGKDAGQCIPGPGAVRT